MKFKIDIKNGINRENHYLKSTVGGVYNLSRTFIVVASLMFMVSCSDEQESEGSAGSVLKGGEKSCGDGENYESGGVTYECTNGEWTEPVGGKNDDTSDKDTDGGKTSDTSGIDAGEGELSTLTFYYDNETREYLLYAPVSYDGSSDVPVMFNFHGFGGTMEGQMYSADMRSLADSENFILVYPQGTLMDGYSHWNASLPSADNKSSADDLGFISALIDEIVLNYQVDSDRVYASGYSNGAFMSYGLACHLSDKIAAIAGVSGTMIDIDNCVPAHKTAVIALHGTSDGVVPYNGGSGFSSVGETLNFWIEYNWTDESPLVESFEDNGTAIEHHSYSDADGNTPVEHYKIDGGNHVWFDIDFDGSNTNHLIWNFVSQWNINGKI